MSQLADLQIPGLPAGSGVEFVQGWVAGIDAAAGAVALDGGRGLAYDRLVYALGDQVGMVTDVRAVADPDKLRFVEPGSSRRVD